MRLYNGIRGNQSMNDYTYGGTSLVIYPSTSPIANTQTDILKSIPSNTSSPKKRTFKERFTLQCIVCAVLLAIVLSANFFGNEIFDNATQRISTAITTDNSIVESFNIDTLQNLFNTVREFFTSTPLPQTNEPAITNYYYPTENKAGDTSPPAVSTNNIAIDPELPNEINSR